MKNKREKIKIYKIANQKQNKTLKFLCIIKKIILDSVFDASLKRIFSAMIYLCLKSILGESTPTAVQ